MRHHPALGFSEELADLSRKLAAIWQTRLALAARKPELAAPLVTQTARSCLQFREFCQKLAEYVCIDRDGRVRPAHLGRKVLAGAAVGASLSLTLGSMGVQAADIHVNADVGDPGCDLIDAILSANANAAVGGCAAGSYADVIHLNGVDQYFSVAHNSDLDGPSATPIVTSDITIEAGGAVISRTVGAVDAFRILTVGTSGSLTVRDATIGGGNVSYISGSAIHSRGRLRIESSAVTGNTSFAFRAAIETHGEATIQDSVISGNPGDIHGVYNYGTLTVENSTISGHSAGGIMNQGMLTVRDSTISDNAGSGGITNFDTSAIIDTTISGNTGSGMVNRGTATVLRSTFSGNYGSAIYSTFQFYSYQPSTLTVIDSTFDGNTSSSGGSGIHNHATLHVQNSTFTANTAEHGSGGAILNYRSATVQNSTFIANSSSLSYGGAIANSGAFTLTDSIVSGNTAHRGGGIHNYGSYYGDSRLLVRNSVLSGNTTTQSGTGGGIHNDGILVVQHSNLESNTADLNGGGIYNAYRLTVQNSTISGNKTVVGDGGGIANVSRLVVYDSRFTANQAGDRGGGLFNNFMLTLMNSMVSSNVASDDGGGIYSRGTLTVQESTVSGNSTGASGGGIAASTGYSYYYGNMTTVQNSTISGNTAQDAGGGISTGSPLTVRNSTISENSAGDSGGIYNSAYGNEATLGSTIVADNFSVSSTNPDVGGSFNSLGFNLIRAETTGSFTAATDMTGTVASPLDARLAPLADNGGSTWTHALLPNSPALDAGRCTLNAATLTRDQRGRTRPFDVPGVVNVDDGCDIGAYENHLLNLVKSVGSNSAQVDDSLLYTLTLRNTFSQTIRIDGVSDPRLVGPFSFKRSNGSQFGLPGNLDPGAIITATVSHVIGDADFTAPAFIAGQLVNTATVAATLDPGGLGLALADVDDARVLLLQPNLSIQKAAAEPVVAPGATITYTLRYANAGPGAAANVYITDTLPPGASFGSVIAAEPPWPNDSQPAIAAGPATTLTWYRPTLPVTPPATDGWITFTVIGPDTPGSITNLAAITSSTPFTPFLSLSDSALVEVRRPTLLLSKSAAASVRAGETLTYTLNFANTGPGSLTAVTLTDTLPVSVTYGGLVSAPAGISQPDPNLPMWQIATLPPGSYSLVFTTTVNPARIEPLTNQAVIASSTPLADDSLLTAAFVTSVAQRGMLSIGKSAYPEPVVAGQPITYTLAVTNTGPSAALNVVITDTLPVSVTYGGLVTASAGITQPDANVAVWQAPTLQPGVYSIVFTATVDAAARGSITNSVAISTTTPQVGTDGLRATHSTPVVPQPFTNMFLPAIHTKTK